jgi:outer membrane protein assembly factor BamD
MLRPAPGLLRVLVLGVLGLLAAGSAACGGSVRDNGTTAHVEYSVSAQQNYERGMKKLQDESWIEAVRFFQFVKSRFPYSKFAVLADLRLADAALGAESYLEAIDQYKVFIKFHPTHEMVENGYAAYKIGDAYFHMLPDEWFLAPPAFEKDQTSAHDASRELQNVIKNYASSPYAKKAKDLYDKTARLLAAHEYYVAEFYWKRNQPMGTVLRLRNLLKNYPGVGYDESSLYLLGQAYVKIGKKDDAKKSLQTLIERYPKSDKAGDAKQMISGLGG